VSFRWTARFEAFDHDFAVTSDNDPLVGYLDQVFAPLAATGPASHSYAIRTEGAYCELAFDDEILVRSTDRTRPVAHLMWHVNRTAATTSRYAVLHAAAAELDGNAVLLPGTSMSGKTTLVAGLASAGLRYLSDELVAIDPAYLRVLAYPKPLSLDPGSWAALPALQPVVEPAVRPYLPHQWQVSPTSFGPDPIAREANPRLVVFPRYDRDADLSLARLADTEALAAASRCAVNLRQTPSLFATLGRVVARCECYSLVSSDLGTAVEVITDLLRDNAGVRDRIA
jgi:hypothetical protein